MTTDSNVVRLRAAVRRRPPTGGDYVGGRAPIVALGTLADGRVAFLDSGKNLRVLRAAEVSKPEITVMAGERGVAWLRRRFPHRRGSFDAGNAAEALLVAAARAGRLELDGVRGAGCWPGEGSEPVWHLGGHLMVRGRRAELGRRGPDFVYVADRPQPPTEAGGAPAEPVARALDVLGSWRFRHKAGARLLLGWLGCAVIGGWLPVRGHLALVGPPEAGKSELLGAVERLLGGPAAVLKVSASSAAGLRQLVGRRTLPIIADEQVVTDELLNYARASFGGDIVVRGGDTHAPVAFTARSAIALATGNLPPLTRADRSRWVELQLDGLDRDGPALELSGLIGAGGIVRSRLLAGIGRLPGLTGRFGEVLGGFGWPVRGVVVFGQILGAGALLLSDEEPGADEIRRRISEVEPFREVYEHDSVPAWRDCLVAVQSASTELDGRRGDRVLVGRLLRQAGGDGASGSGLRLAADAGEAVAAPVPSADQAAAMARLAALGIRIVDVDGRRWVAVANHAAGLAQLLERSAWREGRWREALRQAPEARLLPTTRFADFTSRAVAIPLELALEGLLGD